MLWQSSDTVHIESKLKSVDILKFIMNIPLAKLRCSAHRIKIEIGRYVLKFIMNIPLAKLRWSAHRIKIEIGRYIKVYNEHTTTYEQLPREKRICDTCKDQVEDEQHFIPDCKLNENLRQGVFSDPENLSNYGMNQKKWSIFRSSKRIWFTKICKIYL